MVVVVESKGWVSSEEEGRAALAVEEEDAEAVGRGAEVEISRRVESMV